MSELKKIILVITDSHGVSKGFVTDDFQYLLLKNALVLAKQGILIGVHIVKSASGTYLRSDRNSSRRDNLDSLSVPAGSVSDQIKQASIKNRALRAYAQAHGKFLELMYDKAELLYLDQIAQITKEEVSKRIGPLKNQIKKASEKYGIKAEFLAAILIDELARSGPDDLLDILGKLGVSDTTVGLAQVKMSTARDLIKKKYVPIDPNISDSKLYELLINDRKSLQFAAAYISFIRKYREKRNLGTTAAELATCYSKGLRKPADSRGKQIVNKLTKYARAILKN